MPWACNKRETIHCYPWNVDRCCTWSEVAWCCRWNLSAFFKICFCFVLPNNKSLNDWSLGEQWILFPSNLNVSLNFISGNNEIPEKQNSLFPSLARDQSLSVKYCVCTHACATQSHLSVNMISNTKKPDQPVQSTVYAVNTHLLCCWQSGKIIKIKRYQSKNSIILVLKMCCVDWWPSTVWRPVAFSDYVLIM